MCVTRDICQPWFTILQREVEDERRRQQRNKELAESFANAVTGASGSRGEAEYYANNPTPTYQRPVACRMRQIGIREGNYRTTCY